MHTDTQKNHAESIRTGIPFLAADIDFGTGELVGAKMDNRPAFLWIAEDFGVLRFRLIVKRGPW